MFKTNDLLESIGEKFIVGGVWGNVTGTMGAAVCLAYRESSTRAKCVTLFSCEKQKDVRLALSRPRPPRLFIQVMSRRVCHREYKRPSCPHKFPRDRAERLQL